MVRRIAFSLSKVAIVAVLTLMAAGCANGRKPVVPVRGKVFLGGKPADGALVVFNPVEDNDPKAVRPQGTVGKDGAFEMTTYKENDGVPPGEYNVTFVWLIEIPKTKKEWSPLSPRYMDPDRSGVRVTVGEGTTDLPPFTLTR